MSFRLTIATRIFLGYAIVLLTFGTVALFAVAEMHRSRIDIRMVAEGFLPLSQLAAAMDTFHSSRPQTRDVDSFAESLNRHVQLELPAQRQRIVLGATLVAKMISYAPSDAVPALRDISERMAELRAQYDSYDMSAMNALHAIAQGDNLIATLRPLTVTEDGIGTQLTQLRGLLDAATGRQVQMAQARERRNGVIVIGLSVIAVLVGIIVTWLSARSLRPIRELSDAVAKVREGDFLVQLTARGNDEIAQLSRDFMTMSSALIARDKELAEKNQKLVDAERLAVVGRVAAQIAHEIRNPLSSIGLNVELLGDIAETGAKSSNEARSLVSAIVREIDRLTEMTENHLRLARAPLPSLQRQDIRTLVDDVMRFTKEELERAKIVVRTEIPPTPLLTDFDASQLRQVLVNFVRNAREAMPQGGNLTLRLLSKDEKIAIEVEDSGPGLRPDAQARLFEPFYSTKKNGTGLGLSVSRQIAQTHGGDIEVTQAHPHGAIFTLWLKAEA